MTPLIISLNTQFTPVSCLHLQLITRGSEEMEWFVSCWLREIIVDNCVHGLIMLHSHLTWQPKIFIWMWTFALHKVSSIGWRRCSRTVGVVRVKDAREPWTWVMMSWEYGRPDSEFPGHQGQVTHCWVSDHLLHNTTWRGNCSTMLQWIESLRE